MGFEKIPFAVGDISEKIEHSKHKTETKYSNYDELIVSSDVIRGMPMFSGDSNMNQEIPKMGGDGPMPMKRKLDAISEPKISSNVENPEVRNENSENKIGNGSNYHVMSGVMMPK